jgi:hypothetical protein
VIYYKLASQKPVGGVDSPDPSRTPPTRATRNPAGAVAGAPPLAPLPTQAAVRPPPWAHLVAAPWPQSCRPIATLTRTSWWAGGRRPERHQKLLPHDTSKGVETNAAAALLPLPPATGLDDSIGDRGDVFALFVDDLEQRVCLSQLRDS